MKSFQFLFLLVSFHHNKNRRHLSFNPKGVNCQLFIMEEKTLRILVAGNDGSGKTSFVAVLQGVMTESGSCPMVDFNNSHQSSLKINLSSIKYNNLTK